MIDLRDGKITDLINNQMAYNPETISIGYAILQEKQRLIALAERTRLMAVVEDLDEWVLDYLAVELRTPAYEDGLPIEVKRKLIAGTLPFYTKLGTPAVVDWAINALFKDGYIQEWFEYGGEPYHFKVNIHIARMITMRTMEELLRVISRIKRLSSWLDEIIYTITIPAYTLLVGCVIGKSASIGVPAGAERYSFHDKIYTGFTVGELSELPVPEDMGTRPAPTILRIGGVCTIMSNLSTGE